MTTEDELQRLASIVASLTGSVVAHDSQIESLIKVVEKQSEQFAILEKLWTAYINTLPRA